MADAIPEFLKLVARQRRILKRAVKRAGPPLAVMPDYMRTVSNFIPLTYVVNIVQDP